MWQQYIFLQPERQQPVVLAMVDLHQFFIYTSEGNLVFPLSRYKLCINNNDY